MTALASYAFNTTLAGNVVRLWACGRYLNNSGGTLTPTVTTTFNSTTLLTQALTVLANNVALAWDIEARFYFSSPQVSAGVGVSIGSQLKVNLSNAVSTATQTGGMLATDTLLCSANPYAVLLTPNQLSTLALSFNTVGGEALEVHASTMEAL